MSHKEHKEHKAKHLHKKNELSAFLVIFVEKAIEGA